MEDTGQYMEPVCYSSKQTFWQMQFLCCFKENVYFSVFIQLIQIKLKNQVVT